MRNDEGFDAFCRRAHAPLVGALAHHVGDPWLGEELAQEALVRAGERWDRVRTLDSPVGWCFHVGANVGRSWFRRRGAERRALARRGADPAGHEPADPTASAAVADALALLTARQREVVVLRHLLGLGVDEVAATLDISATAVTSATQRGLAVLRDRLGPDLLPRDEAPPRADARSAATTPTSTDGHEEHADA